MIKHLEIWSSIPKDEKKNQNFSSCELSLGLRYQQIPWGLKFNHKEWKKIKGIQWAKPWALIWRSRQRELQQTVWSVKFKHKEWKKSSKFQLRWAKPWAQISTNRLRFEV
jgi:hypothetical protein